MQLAVQIQDSGVLSLRGSQTGATYPSMGRWPWVADLISMAYCLALLVVGSAKKKSIIIWLRSVSTWKFIIVSYRPRAGAPCSGKHLTVDFLVLKQSPYTIGLLNIQVEYAVHLPHAVPAIAPQVFTSTTAI